ncbi:hypothetical protein LguiA_014733 [Lonicera macranthoides]
MVIKCYYTGDFSSYFLNTYHGEQEPKQKKQPQRKQRGEYHNSPSGKHEEQFYGSLKCQHS